MVFGLLLVLALMLDLQKFARHRPHAHSIAGDLQQLVLGETGGSWTHPQGWFTVRCPAGWRMRTGVDSAPYDIVLYGPAATDISIMVTPVPYDYLPPLVRDIERSEEMAGLSVPKDPFFFKGAPAVRRTARLKTQSVLAIDFVKDGLAHHIMCGLPHEHFEQYRRAVVDWLQQHYHPGSRTEDAGDETRTKTLTGDEE